MKPIVARRYWSDRVVLILALLDKGEAVIVSSGGRMDVENVANLIVLRPSMDFPIGYDFSEVETQSSSLEPVS